MDFREIIDHINKEMNHPRLINSIAIEKKSSTGGAKARFSVVAYTAYLINLKENDNVCGINRETLDFIEIAIFAALEEEGELDYVDDIIIRSMPYV